MKLKKTKKKDGQTLEPPPPPPKTTEKHKPLYSSTVCVMLDGSQQESRERGVHFAGSSEQIHGPAAPCLDVHLVACVEM